MTSARTGTTAARRALRIFALAAMSVMLLAACGKSKTAEDFIRSAQAHRDAGELSAAIIDFKNALQKDPKNLQARVLLGQSYVDVSDGVSGEAELLNARQGGATPLVLAKPMAEAELILGKPANALKETAQLPQDAPAPLKASLLSLRGQAYMALGQMDAARDAFAAGLKEDPRSIDVLAGKARYELALGNIAGARDQVALAEQVNAKAINVTMLKGVIDLAAAQFPEAEQAFQSAIKAQSWNLIAYVNLARAEIAQDKLKEANGNLAIVLKSAPNDPRTNYLRALSAYRAKDFAGAKSYSERALGATKDFAPALILAGASNYALNQFEQANIYLNQYVYQVPQNVEGRKLLAAVQMRLGHPRDAVRTLSPVTGENSSDVQLLTMIGNAAARSGDLVQANRYLSAAVEKQPDSSALRAQLGATEIALGKSDTGIAELEKATQQDPKAIAPEVVLILSYIRNKDYGEALTEAEKLKAQHPNEAVSYDVIGMVHLVREERPDAKAAFLKARELNPGDANALRGLAQLAVQDGQLDTAGQYFEELLKADPKNSGVAVDLAELQAKAGNTTKSRATLEQAIAQDPDNSAPRLALARLLLLEGENEQSLKAVAPALQKNPREPALLEVSGRAQLALGHGDAAIAAFKTLTEAAPQSSAAHRYLANAYLSVKNLDSAVAEATKAVDLDAKDAVAKVTLANMLMAKKDFPAARKVVDAVVAQAPQDPGIAEMDGLLWMAQDRPKDAVTAFKRALALADNNIFRTRLAQAQAKLGDLDDAAKTLSPWVEQHPTDAVSRMALGDIYMQAKRLGDARDQYAAIVQQDPKNFVAENNLAWTLLLLDQPKDALEHAQHAAAASPNSADVLDTLGMVLLRDGQPAEAVTTLQKAVRIAPSNAPMQYHLGQALIGAGDKDKARDVLSKLIASGQPFDEREQAQKLLQGL